MPKKPISSVARVQATTVPATISGKNIHGACITRTTTNQAAPVPKRAAIAAVAAPKALRYALQNDPADANLVNAVGLPASPFRSDDWKLP